MAGLSAATGAASSAYSSRKAAKAAYEQNVRQYMAAISNFVQQANTNNTRYSQEQESVYQKAQQVYLENLQAKATAQASAAGSGVVGNTIDNLFRGYDRANAINNYFTERNLRLMGLQYDDNYEAIRVNALNQIYGIQGYTGPSSNQIISQGIFDTVNSVVNKYNTYKRGK